MHLGIRSKCQICKIIFQIYIIFGCNSGCAKNTYSHKRSCSKFVLITFRELSESCHQGLINIPHKYYVSCLSREPMIDNYLYAYCKFKKSIVNIYAPIDLNNVIFTYTYEVS